MKREELILELVKIAASLRNLEWEDPFSLKKIDTKAARLPFFTGRLSEVSIHPTYTISKTPMTQPTGLPGSSEIHYNLHDFGVEVVDAQGKILLKHTKSKADIDRVLKEIVDYKKGWTGIKDYLVDFFDNFQPVTTSSQKGGEMECKELARELLSLARKVASSEKIGMRNAFRAEKERKRDDEREKQIRTNKILQVLQSKGLKTLGSAVVETRTPNGKPRFWLVSKKVATLRPVSRWRMNYKPGEKIDISGIVKAITAKFPEASYSKGIVTHPEFIVYFRERNPDAAAKIKKQYEDAGQMGPPPGPCPIREGYEVKVDMKEGRAVGGYDD